MKNKISLFALFLCFFSHAQKIKFEGVITDSLKTPLSYVNVIAEQKDNNGILFSISDEKGRYQLSLQKDIEYEIKVSYIGFKSRIITIRAIEDTIFNFVLKEKTEVLDEIKIDAKLAVSIKKDTITYQTNRFITGEERKLKDVLKKLPGVEVDRLGNVTVQGKRVTKVLVEDKPFFTGDSKLAVNNIPADAVNEVEIIDNYNEIALLKNLEDSDDMAMNIKLKDNKKKFWFGDIETGGGIEERYLAHPSLFYYSPKTSVNIIGDFNNIGEKSFTFRDYLDFEGGYNKILLNPKAYFSRLNDDFSQFLNNQNFRNSKHLFGGTNLNQSISDNTDIIGYAIYSQSKNELQSQNINEYIGETGSLLENRITTNNPVNTFVIGKIALENNHNDGGKFRVQSFIKTSDNLSDINTSTSFNTTTNFINTTTQADNIDFKQDVEWYKGLSKNHTLTTLAHINYTKSNSLTNWKTDDDVFQDAIPVIDDNVFNLFKSKETTTKNFSLLLKHYWVMSDFAHLYTTGGIQSHTDSFFTNEFQILSNGDENNFSLSNFGNNVSFNFDNIYLGTHLKFQKGKFTFKPGLFFHQYFRSVEQLDQTDKLNKGYLLPELSIKVNLKRGERVNLRYNRKVRFPSILRLIENSTLTNFNSIYRGNSSLENELYHQVSIFYNKFSLFRKLNYNVRLSYKKTEKGIRNQTILDDINFITQPVLLDNADENISLSGSTSKGYGKIVLTLNSSISRNNYLQITNGSNQRNTSNNTMVGAGFKTKFSEFPNVDITFSRSLSNYRTPISTTKFEDDNLELGMEYDFWKNFIFNLDYNYRRFNNVNARNTNQNDILNTSLIYNNVDSSWLFEISANNVFNNKFIRNSSFTDFLVIDSRTFVLPRIVMFKLAYKL